MRVLLVLALVATAAFAVEGIPAEKREKTDETIQLISLLKKLVMEEVVSKKYYGSGSGGKDIGSGGSGGRPDDPYKAMDEIRRYLEEQFPNDLDRPAFELKEETLTHALGAVVHIMAVNVPDDMKPLVLARMTQAFLEHIIGEATGALYEIAGEILYTSDIFDQMGSGSGNGGLLGKQFDKKTFIMKKSKNAERFRRAQENFGKHKKSLDKKYFGSGDGSGNGYYGSGNGYYGSGNGYYGSGNGYYGSGSATGGYGDYYCIYDALWDAVAAPADDISWSVYLAVNEYDPYYYGYLFHDLENRAEDGGLLHRSLRDAASEIAWTLSYYMFDRPYGSQTLPGFEIFDNIVDKIDDLSTILSNLGGNNFPDIADKLEGIERGVFMEVMDVLKRTFAEATPFITKLANDIRDENLEEVLNFFTGYAANIFGEQLELLGRVEEIMRNGYRQKADVTGRLVGAIKEGRGEDVMVAIFTKFAHASMANGVRLEAFMYFAGELLDQVDRDINPDAYGSGDSPSKPSGGFRGRSGSSGSGGFSGSMKRFLKMKTLGNRVA